ncbi:MAG: hypothetical protein KDA05_11720 [Phycisphaerales bacterium]|nr:hypothetical protein [Phycisphaerales bacterium]
METIKAHMSGRVVYLLNKALFDAMIAALGRLLDPASTGAFRNASIDAFLSLPHSERCADEVLRLREARESARTQYSHVLAIRNKVVAHADHNSYVTPADELKFTIEQLELLIDEMQSIVGSLDRLTFSPGRDWNHTETAGLAIEALLAASPPRHEEAQ